MRKTSAIFAAITVIFFFVIFLLWKNLRATSNADMQISLSLDDKIESLDPAKAFSNDSLIVSAQVLEPLFQYHYLKRPYEIEPLLADDLPRFSEKNKVVTIKIKKGVFYHPHKAFGTKKRELIAEDFVNQFKRLALKDLASPAKGIFSGLIEGFDSYSESVNHDWKKISASKLSGVEALDKYNLVLRLTRPEPNIIYFLALNFVTPIPWELISFQNNKFDDVLIGTGPYVLKNYNNQYIDLEKFSSYREDFYPSSGDRYANMEKLLESSKEKIPFIGKVRFYLGNDERERWEQFLNHEIDLLSVPKSFISKIYDKNGALDEELKDRDIVLKHFSNLSNRWLSFNMKNPMMGSNKNLRYAIAHAIDYSKYIEIASLNTNLRANSILVPGIPGYRPTKDFKFNYNLDLAKDFFKLAGFDPSKKRLKMVFSTRSNQEANLIEARFIKEQLVEIGIDVEIEVLTFPEFLKKGRTGQLMFFIDNWLFDYPDGENIMQLLISSNSPGINKSGYSNNRVDELYNQLKDVTNLEQRDFILKEMENIVLEDIPWIPLMYESSFVLQYPEIKNYRKSSIIRNFVKYLKIEE